MGVFSGNYWCSYWVLYPEIETVIYAKIFLLAMINKVKQIIIKLSKEEGEVIPIAQILRIAVDRGNAEKDVKEAIKELIDQGMIVKLDKDSVQLTAS